jgi:DNA helicase HerA-like ATPase
MPTEPFFIAQGPSEIYFLPQMANRHGLIAGATGTGKTVTLRVLAENFSAIGVPVFLADVKGDLSGLAKPGATSAKVKERAAQLGLDVTPNGFPVVFWDVFGKKGHPVRATISEMGPLLLSRLLSLNETQEGVLNIVFHIADENGLLLIDIKDLQAMLQYVAQNAAEFTIKYGNVALATVGTIQRALLTLQQQGGEKFFGEPAMNLDDLMKNAGDGRGTINILAADELMTSPRTYAAFMLWLLSELFERLPEVGDVDKPKLVFFFDEAHLLFSELPPAMQEKIEQVVRLIRSKGIGVYFVSQNPLDIPDKVLGQLGNRIQHALRAFTPRDQKAVKAAAETFRANPKLNVEAVIGELEVGEALVSLLDAKGIPGVVQRAFIAPPVSQLDPIAEDERKILFEGSEIFGAYETTVDRESAYEILQGKPAARAAVAAPTAGGAAPYDAVAAARARAAARQAPAVPGQPSTEAQVEPRQFVDPRLAKQQRDEELHQARLRKFEEDAELKRQREARRPGMFDALVKAATTSAVRTTATQIMRGVMGSIFGQRRR